MTKITKKEFRALHTAGKLAGIASLFKKSKEDIIALLDEKNIDITEHPTFKTSRVDLGNDHDYSVTTVYTEQIQGIRCYFVETVTDNSKCRTCSWNDIETSTVFYRLAI
jgi:hypothetical protein